MSDILTPRPACGRGRDRAAPRVRAGPRHHPHPRRKCSAPWSASRPKPAKSGRGVHPPPPPRRGPLRRHLRRARGQPLHRRPGDRRPARRRLRGHTNRGGRRSRRGHRRPVAPSRRGVQRAARPLRRGRRDPGRARLAGDPLHAFRRARLGPGDGQGSRQGGVRRARPAGRRRAASFRWTNCETATRCRCPTSSSRSTKARRSASRSSATATTAAPTSRAPGGSAAPRWSRNTSPAAS